MLHIPPTKILISYNRSNTKQKQQPYKKAYLSENGDLGTKKLGERANSGKGYHRKSDRTRQKNKRGDIVKV